MTTKYELKNVDVHAWVDVMGNPFFSITSRQHNTYDVFYQRKGAVEELARTFKSEISVIQAEISEIEE